MNDPRVEPSSELTYRCARRIDAASVVLEDRSQLQADLVVMGVGVRPRLQLAELLRLNVDSPVPRGGPPIRVEHWVVAERQGERPERGGRQSRPLACRAGASSHGRTRP